MRFAAIGLLFLIAIIFAGRVYAAIDPSAAGEFVYNGTTIVGDLNSGFDAFYDYTSAPCGNEPVRVQAVYTFSNGISHSSPRIVSGNPVLPNPDNVSALGNLQSISLNFSSTPNIDQNGQLVDVCYTYNVPNGPFVLTPDTKISLP